MDKGELVELLGNIAKGDLTSGADIHDHPCSVAIRALDKCFEDIRLLKTLAPRKGSQSKKVQMLLGLSYNPEW